MFGSKISFYLNYLGTFGRFYVCLLENFFLNFFNSLGSPLISWKSKKQEVVSKSLNESKYRTLGHTTSEFIWLCWLLWDLGISISGPIPLYTDSDSAKRLAFNDLFHDVLSMLKMTITSFVNIFETTLFNSLISHPPTNFKISSPKVNQYHGSHNWSPSSQCSHSRIQSLTGA